MMRASIILFTVSMSTTCLADKLPSNAVPLTEEEAKNIYSGKTAVYNVSDEYYAPDGTTKGVFGKPKPKAVFAGTWSVKGNEVCAMNVSPPDAKVYTDCNKFWRAKNRIYSLWTVHYDGSKPNGVTDYGKDEDKKFKAGDLVSATYAKMGGK